MFRRSSIALVIIAACGSPERRDPTTPLEDDKPTCPSDAAPERCRELADAAASAGNHELAWAYTVLECESPTAMECAPMWQRYSKLAPSQTDALNLLHVACGHGPAACEQLATWHLERGHTLAAAAYHKRVEGTRQAPGATSLALATDLAAIMHVADAQPRTDKIAQQVSRQLPAPIAHALPAAQLKPQRKAWAMHAAAQGTSADDCSTTATLDRHPVSLAKCVSEVRPFDEDQIAVRNRCSQPVTVAYAGARSDHTTYSKQIRLEPYEALSAGISHRELGPLTYAVCPGECRVTSSPDDVTGSWTGQDERYYCTRGGAP
jgi:hypothetical protein